MERGEVGPGRSSSSQTDRLCVCSTWRWCPAQGKGADGRKGKSGSKAISVLEGRCSGSSGPTLEFRRRRRGMKAWGLRRQTSGCRDRSWPGGRADLHVVWGCRAHFNQGLCSADASGRSSCQSSRFPSDVRAAPHRLASLAPLQPLTYTLVHE